VRYFDHIGHLLAPDAPRGITPSDLDNMAAHFGVEVRSGDILLLHTGWAEHWLGCTPGQRAARTGSPGLHQSEEMLAWLWDHQISIAAADNGGLESFPVDPGSGWVDPGEPPPPRGPSHNGMMHRPLIGLLGMIIGELWKLDELAEDCAADGVYEFLLTAKPLNLLGGVGSPPNALAVK
jgi:kynurenine formamidase